MRRSRIIRRRSVLPPIEDDGLVGYHQGTASPEYVEWNSRHHMAGFDDLHPRLRRAINEAETPEEGALPVIALVGENELGETGPWALAHRHGDAYWQMLDSAVTQRMTAHAAKKNPA